MTQQSNPKNASALADAQRPRLAGSQRTRRAHVPVDGQPAPPPKVSPQAISDSQATPEQRRAHWGRRAGCPRIEDATPAHPNRRIAAVGAVRLAQPIERSVDIETEQISSSTPPDHERSALMERESSVDIETEPISPPTPHDHERITALG